MTMTTWLRSKETWGDSREKPRRRIWKRRRAWRVRSVDEHGQARCTLEWGTVGGE